MQKRILSLMLALVMVLGMFPMGAFAAEDTTNAIYNDGTYTGSAIAKFQQVQSLWQRAMVSH